MFLILYLQKLLFVYLEYKSRYLDLKQLKSEKFAQSLDFVVI